MAWCYGDLGIGLALWKAGKAIDNKKWKDKGLEILLQSTRHRILSDNFVIDAEICHGSAEFALIFRRMYLETTMNEFKEASDLQAFADSIENYFRENPPKSICEATAKIKELTGIERKETQVRKFLKGMGFRHLRVGEVPAKALTEEKKTNSAGFWKKS